MENTGSKDARDRANEELVYESVAREIGRGQIRPGLWAKATADAGGDLEKAKAIYIRLRVQSVFDEADLLRRRDEMRTEVERRSSENGHPSNDMPARPGATLSGARQLAFLFLMAIAIMSGIVFLAAIFYSGRSGDAASALVLAAITGWLAYEAAKPPSESASQSPYGFGLKVGRLIGSSGSRAPTFLKSLAYLLAIIFSVGAIIYGLSEVWITLTDVLIGIVFYGYIAYFSYKKLTDQKQ